MMLKFSANLSTLFQDRPLAERIAAARAAGFGAVEMWFPYDVPPDQLRATLHEHGLPMIGINSAPGNVGAGDWGLAADPRRRGAFVDSLHEAFEYARMIGCPNVHVMAGIVDSSISHAAAWDTYEANIDEACRIAAHHALTVMIEPLNAVDRPAYLLTRQRQAIALIEKLKRPNLKIMLDLFHVQRGEGNLIERMLASLPHAAHVQIADVPGRHEPGTGEINFRKVFDTLQAAGWNGWVGAEYFPLGGTEAGLGWMGSAADGTWHGQQIAAHRTAL
ncbi:hydroxypyruvate isomerase family protein [Paraburkholderia humisilvae]|uniref:2-oxo-tetronate isomerase n=1 Tax=Paraburkholderia humisilvae TaxID=627669 RepID=A0A6J5DHG3_9BURK|nr:TIM barrel protein [Paraburkholderia humisilvae]CAB3753679.1 2-oxo-tetronate isomerase [Paraburkholderia humisilvae]